MSVSRIHAVVFAGGVFLFSCRPGELPPAKKPRHVLLVTIDTLRHDYVSYSGAGKVETPHLDRLARGGVVFNEARSPVPLTLPAHASLLTGAYPPWHGVRVNGLHRLAEARTTLTEVLHSRGFATTAFLGSFVLDRRFGLAQGFDVYDDQLGTDIGMLENLEAERNAEAVAEAFRRWLDQHPVERPFFAWVHFYDPHAPYTPPEPYRRQYPSDAYAGEVAYTDAMVGRLVEALERRGLLAETLLSVVGDHGEGLGEHDEQTHSLLIYNSTLHVPFLLHAPGVFSGGGRVEARIATVDLAPTLLDYLGVQSELAQGRSLRPLIEGGRREEAAIYSESLYASIHLGWSELSGLERGGFRYVAAPSPELYDLAADPGERQNLFSGKRELAREMESELKRLRSELQPEETSEQVAMDPDTEMRLKSLGYLSAARPRTTGRAAVDPKDKMGLWNELQLGIHELGRQNYAAAREIFEKILAEDKDVPLVYENLGALYMALGRYREAERVYRQALSRGLESADFHLNLGLVHQNRREWSAARKEFQLALALDDLNVTARVHLGNTLRAEGELSEAIAQYRKTLEISPRYVYAFDGLGIAMSKLGRQEEALDAFRQVVRLAPEAAQGYFNLAVQLERMEKRDEALTAYREVAKRAGTGSPAELTRRAEAALKRLEARRNSRSSR
jgi:arylsulfatase A-like enzyme/Tfp pilus assembly protein PilF